MAKKLALIFALIVLVIFGFALIFRPPSILPVGLIPQRPAPAANLPVPEIVTVILSAQNDSGESGTSTISEAEGKAAVELHLTGAPVGVTQPAHIHSGSCADLGAVKYPLTFPVGGVSATTLDVSLAQLLAELPLAVNVRKSGSQPTVYVSCGDIVVE